jgi:fatty-acyl-CoA synthase
MQRFRIETAADLARIAERPYRDFMAHGTVYDALADTAARHPDRPALTFIESADPAMPPRRWTHAALLDEVRATANLFASLVPGEPVRVAMLLPAIPEAYLTLFGGETAGVVCPINYLLEAGHVAELIRASGCNLLVALGPDPQLDIWSRVPALRAACPGLKQVLAVGACPEGALDFNALRQAQPRDRRVPPREGGPHDIAALFHTGGTTGAPKLAQHAHGNQLHAAWGAAQMYRMTEHDVILNGFPLFHVAGSFVYGLSALLSGAEVVLPTLLGLRHKAFVERYWDFVAQYRVSLLAAVPTVIATLLSGPAPAATPACTRALLTGGSPLPTELASAFERRFGLPVRNIFGMTECAGVISIEPLLAERVPGSCGLPLPFTEVRAFDGERPCAPGETGILRLRGPNVGPGYTEAERNAGTFTDDGWLVTGDIGHVDAAGRVFVTGREKDVIIRSSHNIDPGVIEEVLLRHPAVAMAAAVGAPDEYAGELPVAFVSLRPGQQVDAEALLAFAREHLPERPAVPKRIDILDSIPTTAVGKVYKPTLRRVATQRVLDERLQLLGLAPAVTVVVDEMPKGLRVRFGAAPGLTAADRARLDDLMRPFPLAYQVTPPSPAPAAPPGSSAAA